MTRPFKEAYSDNLWEVLLKSELWTKHDIPGTAVDISSRDQHFHTGLHSLSVFTIIYATTVLTLEQLECADNSQ